MDFEDAVVVGAGVVGLAIALALARTGRRVLVAEAEAGLGTGVSSRSSEVIHAGLYYPPGSLRARLCVRGRRLLYEFCEARGVPHQRIGKIVFAAEPAELPVLDAIVARASAAGVEALEWLDSDQARRVEPELRCAGALLSPTSGIVDSHAFMIAMLAEIESRGGVLACHARLTGAARDGEGWRLRFNDDPDAELRTWILVNAGGLGAQEVAARIEGPDPALVPRQVLSRGCYFGYAGRVPFSRLIYPVPVPGGLGTHLTFDLAGRARFGPDVEPVETLDYTVDPGRLPRFAAAARRIWPQIDPDRLYPDYAGIRPKIAVPPGEEPDFVVQGPERHGQPGLVQLFGIESPGLTASLALGEEVAERLRGSP